MIPALPIRTRLALWYAAVLALFMITFALGGFAFGEIATVGFIRHRLRNEDRGPWFRRKPAHFQAGGSPLSNNC